MSAPEFSLLAVTFGFVLLVAWVYSPRRRSRLESYGAMPLEEDSDPRDLEDRSNNRGEGS